MARSVFKLQEDEEEERDALETGDLVVLHGKRGVQKTEEDGEADDEFEALLSMTMSESVGKTKIARASTQVQSNG